MTNRETLEALLARVLEGTGPDRELDEEIARSLGWKLCALSALYNVCRVYGDDSNKWWPPAAVEDARQRKRSILHHPTQPLPMFTASLDAALTLVPDGWDWVRRTPNTMALVRSNDYRMAEVHPNPCRALIAACLKARMEALVG